MSNPFIGEIRMAGFNFPPVGWARCDGQLQAIAQNDALFALIGTTYGGDGQNTFALPDLRSRVPVHMGTGAGLSTKVIGQVGGTETVTLTTTQIPAHNHSAVTAAAGGAAQASPGSAAAASGGPDLYAATRTVAGSMTLATAGSTQPHDNIPPILTVNFIIALFGVFPTRN